MHPLSLHLKQPSNIKNAPLAKCGVTVPISIVMHYYYLVISYKTYNSRADHSVPIHREFIILSRKNREIVDFDSKLGIDQEDNDTCIDELN